MPSPMRYGELLSVFPIISRFVSNDYLYVLFCMEALSRRLSHHIRTFYHYCPLPLRRFSKAYLTYTWKCSFALLAKPDSFPIFLNHSTMWSNKYYLRVNRPKLNYFTDVPTNVKLIFFHLRPGSLLYPCSTDAAQSLLSHKKRS